MQDHTTEALLGATSASHVDVYRATTVSSESALGGLHGRFRARLVLTNTAHPITDTEADRLLKAGATDLGATA